MTDAPICAIVGAGPGLGLALARRFGREGFRIALLARDADALARHAAELAPAGIESRTFAADAGDPASLEHAFSALRAALGDPTVLIYNAALVRPGPPSALYIADLLDAFRVDVGGALIAVQQVLTAMRAARRGTILVTGGGLALEPWPQYAALAIGKAGVRSLAFSFAKELEPAGIHVATVTVRGLIKPGTRFDADRIADEYWQLHLQPPGTWQREVLYDGPRLGPLPG